MNILYTLLAIMTISIVLTSCSSKSKVQSTEDAFDVTYKITKGRSKTKPAFSMVLDSHNVLYNGIANMSVMGEKSYKLDQEKFNNLNVAFKSSNFKKFESEYMGRMRDLPIATLSYNGHSVRYQKREAPAALIVLDKMMDELVP